MSFFISSKLSLAWLSRSQSDAKIRVQVEDVTTVARDGKKDGLSKTAVRVTFYLRSRLDRTEGQKRQE